MMRDTKIKSDLKRVWCVSSLIVLVLFGVMVFSPLATQISDKDVSRGIANVWDMDSLVWQKEYRNTLAKVDSVIAEKSRSLPTIAFFDRFLSKQERYEATIRRAEIYDLQWKRIVILKAKNDKEALKEALEDYCDVIGYNQERAKAMLEQMQE